uniref:Uncharacterized protein n=1 Tax=Vitis vinifera TaxID=29760 RepID=F6HBT5_VITVI
MWVLNQPPTISLSSPLPSPSPSEATPSNHQGHFLFSLLNSVLQSNILQRDTILGIMRHLSSSEFIANCAADGGCMPMYTSVAEKSMLEAAHEREKDLLHEVAELQWRLICAQEEIQKFKTENAQV